VTDDRSVAETFGLDPDQARGHPDVPLPWELLSGVIVTVDDGVTREPALLALDRDAFARVAWMKREAARLIAAWREGRLLIYADPDADGQPGTVEIEEGGSGHLEDVPWPVFQELQKARRAAGGS
jgi:hypothetical protein